MRRPLLAGTVLLASALIAPAAAQASWAPGAVTVATGVTATSNLDLLGVSGTAYAVARNGTSVLATTAGDPLTDYDTAYDDSTSLVSDLTGGILRWAEPKGAGSPAWVIHREPVFGGARVDYDSPDQPYAFTPDSWIGYRGGTLARHVFGGATTTLATGLTAVRAVRADAAGALVLYGVTVNGQARTRVGLVTFGRAGIDMLQEHVDANANGENPLSIALTPGTAVWYSNLVTDFGKFHRRARAGGAVSSADSPALRSGRELVATDTEIATTSIAGGGAAPPTRHLWAFKGPAWREIALPAPLSGQLRASASTLAFAVSGDDATTAGVYTIGTGTTPTLVARPRPRAGVVGDVSLQAGRLTYGVSTGTGLTNGLRRAAVSTSGTLTVGAPAAFANGVSLAHVRTAAPTAALSVSGDRATVRTDASGVRAVALTDAGVRTGQTPVLSATELPVKRSGAYTLADGKVYRGDGLTPLLDLTARKCRGADLFGSLVVCNQPDGKNVMIDAEGRFPTGTTSGTGIGPVAIWGTAVAWAAAPDQISVQDLNVAGSLRTVSTGPVPGLHDLQLREGSISFTDHNGDLSVFDRAGLTRYAVALRAPVSIDDHLAAGIAGDSLQVRTLPFGLTAKYRPRLIDAVAPAAFTGGTWNPVFDVSKPLTNVKVTIRSGATVVATLTGTGTTGTVRDVSWNGRTAAGADAPAGDYTWTLTADARDGDGPVAYLDGTSAVTGPVHLTR